MTSDLIITREISPIPERADDIHKGDVGRIAVIGGSCDEVMMSGAPALTAMAALRGGAGLVQVMVPEAIRGNVAVLVPCATLRTLPQDSGNLLAAIDEFGADVVAIGPGLGRSLGPAVLVDLIKTYTNSIVIDADGLNLLAAAGPFDIPDPARIVLTPHPGELKRLLAARNASREVGPEPAARRAAACALVKAYGCTTVLKGRGTIVTNADRLYTNETGNAGMATGGTGDVLTGVIAALIGQHMAPFEAAILGVYLHGLAGDFAAEELGRHAMTALDLVEYLPEAFSEHLLAENQ